jgi:hypothetical protein
MDPTWHHHNNKPESDTRLTGTMTAMELRNGWLSRPGSVLDDNSELYTYSPRDPGELRPLKSGKGKPHLDYRGRDNT